VLLRIATHLQISQLTHSLQQQNRELAAEIARRQHAEHER
jgi:phosphoglycerate-specific signal transduction histidine kinase